MNPAEVNQLWGDVLALCKAKKRNQQEVSDLRETLRLMVADPAGRARVVDELGRRDPFAGKAACVREVLDAVAGGDPLPGLPDPDRRRLLVALTAATQSNMAQDVTFWEVLWLRTAAGDESAGADLARKLQDLLGRDGRSLHHRLAELAVWGKLPPDRKVRLLEAAGKKAVGDTQAQIERTLEALRHPPRPAEPPKPAAVPAPVPPAAVAPPTAEPPKAEPPKPEPAAVVPAPAIAEPAPPKAPREPKAKAEPAKPQPEPAPAGMPAGTFSAAGVELDEMARKIEVLYRRSEEDQARQAAERDKLARRVAELEADAERAEAAHRAASDGLKAERDAAQEKADAAARRAEEAEGRIEAERRRAEQAVHEGRRRGDVAAADDRAKLGARLRAELADIPDSDPGPPAGPRTDEQILLDRLRTIRDILREHGVPSG